MRAGVLLVALLALAAPGASASHGLRALVHGASDAGGFTLEALGEHVRDVGLDEEWSFLVRAAGPGFSQVARCDVRGTWEAGFIPWSGCGASVSRLALGGTGHAHASPTLYDGHTVRATFEAPGVAFSGTMSARIVG